VKIQLRRRLLKAASELGLHYFQCRINATAAVKGLNIQYLATWRKDGHLCTRNYVYMYWFFYIFIWYCVQCTRCLKGWSDRR